MVKVLVYSDEVSWAKQLASAAKDLGEGVLITPMTDVVNELTKYFKKVYVAKSDVFEPMSMAKAIDSIIEKEKAEMVLFPCTNKGRMLAGLVATTRESFVVTDALKLTKEGEKVRATKLTFGGNAKVDLLLDTPLVACVVAGAYGEAEPSESGEVIEVEVPRPSVDVRFQPRRLEGVSPEKAEVVVGAGRGIKKREDLEMIKELADVLGGAWSVTRPLAADYGWADNWIGISGLIISPKLYIAIGISGQPHHMMGVRGAKVIVAINNDESAPIFEESDYGVVGDLYKVVPVLIKKLKERRG